MNDIDWQDPEWAPTGEILLILWPANEIGTGYRYYVSTSDSECYRWYCDKTNNTYDEDYVYGWTFQNQPTEALLNANS